MGTPVFKLGIVILHRKHDNAKKRIKTIFVQLIRGVCHHEYMSPSYVEKRLLEALNTSHGNLAKARKLISEWCVQDQRLLYELSRPHMTGIIAHAMDRVVSHKFRSESEKNTSPPSSTRRVELSSSAKSDEMFGKELLKNFAMGKPTKFAEESFSAPLKKTKASQAHIDAIRRLAKKP